MTDLPDFSNLPPWQKPPFCEYTATGSTTEAVDCWAWATVRHVGPDGITKGVFCDAHDAQSLEDGQTVEAIDYAGESR